MGPMILKEMKYNLHYGKVRGVKVVSLVKMTENLGNVLSHIKAQKKHPHQITIKKDK